MFADKDVTKGEIILKELAARYGPEKVAFIRTDFSKKLLESKYCVK